MEMCKVVLDENVIPPMTHPWGKVWKQPDRKNLVLDDKYAMMYRRDFEMLSDYTGSEPTGKYNGKGYGVFTRSIQVWRINRQKDSIRSWHVSGLII